MKKFQFRLESLLKVKEHIEKERQKEHAVSQQRVVDQEGKLQQIDQVRDETYVTQRLSMTGSISVAEMLLYSRYFVRLRGDTTSGKELLRVLRDEAGNRREALLKATKDKKIYEKLKEKQQEKHFKEGSRLETLEEDEIALQTYRLQQ